MATTKADRPTWQERVEPLYKKFREVHARCTWEGYASLNLDKPRQKDIIIQHWCTAKNYYIVRIYANGDGWDVFVPIHPGIEIQPTLDAIT